jgi:hypothetical protein
MPGLFDPQGGGILGGLGGLFGSMQTGAAGPQYQLAQREFQWKMKLFNDQFNALKQQYPEKSDAELLSRMQTPEGTQELYIPRAVGQYTAESGASGPGIGVGGRVTPPSGMGFDLNTIGPGVQGNNGAVPQTTAPQSSPVGMTPQATPGVGGPATAGLTPSMQRGITYKSALRGAEETASKQADALQQYPDALSNAQTTVARLEALSKNPHLPDVVGGLLGVKGRTAALGQEQANIVNEINDLQSRAIGNTYTTIRSAAGRPPTQGTLRELAAGTGDLIAARKGTVEGMQDVIRKVIDQIKTDTQSAWTATGNKGTPPTWGQAQPQQAPQKYPEGTVATNKQTGETRIMRAGHWVAK